MKVFTVIAMDDLFKHLFLETFSTLELGLMRGTWIAHNIYGVTPNETPVTQKSDFSDDTEHQIFQDPRVIITVLEQELKTALPHFRGDHKMDQTPAASPPPVVPVDDPRDPSLPGGWTHYGTPVKMDTVLDDPDSVQPFDGLTTEQKFALTLARISKRPNFSYTTKIGVLVQKSALDEVKRKTQYGWEIVNSEMKFLDDLREYNTVLDIEY